MSEKPFDKPRLAINRVYTRRGDAGQTHLAGGQRVAKDSRRIEAYGTVDELNSWIGLARAAMAESVAAHPRLGELGAILIRVQHELFNLGSLLATLPEDLHPRQARVTEEDVARMEVEIDRMNGELQPLRSFVLPGGSRLDAQLHLARTVCRRAERVCVALSREEPLPAEALKYLNRLGDALFVWSRWADFVTGTPETLWEPNLGASGLS